MKKWKYVATTAVLLSAVASAHAAIQITEVDPTGSSTATYGGDWFELTNTGASAVDITGWKMDDSSNSSAVAVSLRGLTSIPAGASAVFIEDGATDTNDLTIEANFISTWFGAGGAPSGFQIGAYGGSGVGLSSSGDAVNIFDGSDNLVANVSFSATILGNTLDNTAGLNNAAISTTSVAGVHGAFTSSDAVEVGSPGAVPEPASLSLLACIGLYPLARRQRISRR